MQEARTARLQSLAKVNLDLRILHKRADGFHEIRTVFQTISLSDTIRVSYTPASRSTITISGNVDIPGNLIEAAAEAILAISKPKGIIQFDLQKSIPMGGGLGGGSSNAAAVLLGLPALMGLRIPMRKLEEIAASLGSDINFFLHGGTVFGFGRGTELCPMPEIKVRKGWVVAPGIAVSTALAYRDLNREVAESSTGFEPYVWDLDQGYSDQSVNDFEATVYSRHPKLHTIHKKLARAGASAVRMSGSGSSIFAFFDRIEPVRSILEGYTVHRIATVTRRQYRKLWWRQLREHVTPGEIWPPHSRYAQ